MRLASSREFDERDNAVDHRVAEALLFCDQLHEFVGTLDIRNAVIERTRRGSRPRQAFRRRRVFLERHEILWVGAELHAKIVHEIIDRARFLDVGMHRFLRRAHAVLGDAAIVAGEQHRPFRERHENRLVIFELHRQLDLALRRVVADGLDVGLQLLQNRIRFFVVKTRDFEVGRQRHLQHVYFFFWRPNRLRIGATKRDRART